jgi:excisionase family DNA binding protein
MSCVVDGEAHMETCCVGETECRYRGEATTHANVGAALRRAGATMEMTHSAGTFEPLLNTEEGAALLGIHPKTLEKWAREARVPAYNLGRWKFRASELDAWLRRSVHSNAANSAA